MRRGGGALHKCWGKIVVAVLLVGVLDASHQNLTGTAAIWSAGWFTVVSGTFAISTSGLLSYPTTESCSGTTTPRFVATRTTAERQESFTDMITMALEMAQG